MFIGVGPHPEQLEGGITLIFWGTRFEEPRIMNLSKEFNSYQSTLNSFSFKAKKTSSKDK
jgi:hypothetical protein